MIIGSRYEIAGISPLRGGMSEVHKGKDLHLDRLVALKCLQHSEDRQRIIDEQKALQEVISKHVVQLLDVVIEEIEGTSQTFLILEYIDGYDLEEQSLNYNDDYLLRLWQIASGLSEIHRFDVIHRDVKPGNIRIDGEGVVKIFDFGLARQMGVDNQTRGAIGTPLYIAPEMLVSETVHFTTAADVFSFALTALTLLNRPIPHWMHLSYRNSIPDNAVASHVPELPVRLAQVLQACLSRNAAHRPTMEDVCSELTRVLVHGKHSAQLDLAGNLSIIDCNRREGFPKVVVTQTNEMVSGLRISYDGDEFRVLENYGPVLANNIPLQIGDELLPSCVLAFPRTDTPWPYFATFNVNKPEVIV